MVGFGSLQAGPLPETIRRRPETLRMRSLRAALLAALAGLLLPAAGPQQKSPIDFRKYNDVVEWAGTITYSLSDSWNGKLGSATLSGESGETGEISLHLDHIRTASELGAEWLGTGSVTGNAHLKEQMQAGKVTITCSTAAKGTYKALNAFVNMDYFKGSFKAGAAFGTHDCDRQVRTSTSIRTTEKTEKVGWTPATDQLIDDPLPKPEPGLILASGKMSDQQWPGLLSAFNAPIPHQPHVQAYWSLAPVWRDIELVVTIDAYDTWVPEGGPDPLLPGNSVTVHAVLKSKDGKPVPMPARKINFQLLQTSQEPGVCLNAPPPPATPPNPEPFDLRFDPSKNPKMSVLDATFQQIFASGDKITQAQAVVSAFDWGAVGDLKVTAELVDGRVIAGHLDTRSELFRIPLPKRKPFSKIADAWKADHGIDEEDSWDEDAEPKSATVKGDGLTLYEEYRGVVTADGSHVRLDPKKMELFVLDADKLFDPAAWKGASGIDAYRLKDDQHQNQRVNFNSKGKPKYAVNLVKVSGIDDPEKTANELYIWGQTDESVADKPTRCRIFVDRPANGLTNVLHVKVKNALADPNSADGKLLAGDGADTALLQGADKALSDPAAVSALASRLVSYVVVHELGHACDLNHHAQEFKGVMSCPMRNLDGHDKLTRMCQELVTPSPGPFPLGITVFCTSAPDNCAAHLRLKGK
jgi:hypothetical protein